MGTESTKAKRIGVYLLGFIGFIIIIVVSLQFIKFITVVPEELVIYIAIIGVISELGSLFVEILPFVIKPRLTFVDYRDPLIHRPIDVEIIYPKGKFKIKLLVSAIRNGNGHLSSTAEKCEVNLVTFVDALPRRLPFRMNQRRQIILDNDVDPSSPQSIADALQSNIFETQEVDVKRGQTIQTIIGFFLESGKFYFATDDALTLPFAKGDAVLSSSPFYLEAKGSNFSMGQNSHGMLVFGPNWKEAQLRVYRKNEDNCEGQIHRSRTLS